MLKSDFFSSVELSDMERSAPHSFAINLPDPKVANDNKVTSLILSSSTQAQRNKWVSDIELAANRLKQSNEPFYSTASGVPSNTCKFQFIAPIWILQFDFRSFEQYKPKWWWFDVFWGQGQAKYNLPSLLVPLLYALVWRPLQHVPGKFSKNF